MLKFKHILIPTDGSATSARAARAGVELARRLGARIIVYHAIDPVPHGFYADGAPAGDYDKVQLERRARAAGQKHVEVIARKARSAGVPCQSLVEVAVPYEGIPAAARRRKCDAIFMGSHGHRGLKRLLLGSVASRVVATADRPVIVYR